MLTVCHIVHKVYIIGVSSQPDANFCLPGFHQSPYNLVGIIAFRESLTVFGQFQLQIFVSAGSNLIIVVAIDSKGKGGAGFQRLTKIDTEGGPAMACVAQLQGIAATVCRSGHICIRISHSFDSDIAAGITLSDKEICIAFDFEVDAL